MTYLQSLDKALDLFVEFKFCESDVYNNASVILNVATYWLALPFISIVNNVSVIISNLVTKFGDPKEM